MKESKNAEEIYAEVVYKNNNMILLNYSYKERKHLISIPTTDKNRALKVGDNIEMQLMMIL